MKAVIVQCTESLSTVQLQKDTSLTSVSSRLVNLQTAGASLISLGEGRKKGSVRGRKRKLIRSDSSGATEFSLKQILSNLQSLYADYKAALEGRRVSSAVSRKTEKEATQREERAQPLKSPVVKNRAEAKTSSSKSKSRDSSAAKEASAVQVRGGAGDRPIDRRSTISYRAAARKALKAEKLQNSEPSNFRRSYTLPGRFQGRKAEGLSVREKAAAFSRVTEGRGLAAPFGLHASRTRTRRPSLDETRKVESGQSKAPREERVATNSTKTIVREPAKSVVQTAVVRTVISKQEPAKRVSLVNVDAEKSPTPELRSRSPSASPTPYPRVVSPSSAVLPSEQERPPRVISPTPPGSAANRSQRKRSPVVATSPATLSPAKASSDKTRRSIQVLQLAGKVSQLKHMFDQTEEEGGGTGISPSPSPKTKTTFDRHWSPDIVPKVPTDCLSEESCVVSKPALMASRPFPSPDITPKDDSQTEESARAREETPSKSREGDGSASLAPPRPGPPQNYSSVTPSPEILDPPPRPPSPIGYVLDEASDGESSYQSYDTEYSEEEEEEEEVDGGLEEVDSRSISKRTVKTLQYVLYSHTVNTAQSVSYGSY